MWICLYIYILLCSVHKHLYCSQIFVIACANKYMHLNIYIVTIHTYIHIWYIFIVCIYIYIVYVIYLYFNVLFFAIFNNNYIYTRAGADFVWRRWVERGRARERHTYIYIHTYFVHTHAYKSVHGGQTWLTFPHRFKFLMRCYAVMEPHMNRK